MKKILLTFLAILIISCSSTNTKNNNIYEASWPNIDSNVEIISKMGPMPNWLNIRNSMDDNEQMIFFIGYGKSKYKYTALDKARLNAATNAALALKGTYKENKSKEVISLSSENVDVSGLIQNGMWWRYVRKNGSSPKYEYYIRYAFNYDTFKRKIQHSYQPQKTYYFEKRKTSKRSDLNERQNRLYDDINKALSDLDE